MTNASRLLQPRPRRLLGPRVFARPSIDDGQLWGSGWKGSELEAAWGHAKMLAKGFAEIVRGAEAASLSQVLDRELAISDEIPGLFHANKSKVSTWRDSPSLLEQAREVKSAHLRDAGHVRNPNGSRKVLSAELLDLDDECGHVRQATGWRLRRGTIFTKQLHENGMGKR